MGFPELLNLPMDPFKGNDNPTVHNAAPEMGPANAKQAVRRERQRIATDRRKNKANVRKLTRDMNTARAVAARAALRFIRREQADCNLAEDDQLHLAYDQLAYLVERELDKAARKLGL